MVQIKNLELVEIALQCPQEKYLCRININNVKSYMVNKQIHIEIKCKCGEKHIFIYNQKNQKWEAKNPEKKVI